MSLARSCLLYTSDAADDLLCDKAFSDCECELPVTVAGDELRVGSTVIAEKTWTPSLFQWHPKQGAYARYCLGVSDIVLTRKK